MITLLFHKAFLFIDGFPPVKELLAAYIEGGYRIGVCPLTEKSIG